MAKKQLKNKKNSNKKYYNKGYKKIAFIVVLILLIIFFVNQSKIKNNLNKETQIILNNENITSNLKDDIIKENGKIYISFEDVKNVLDKNLYKETETGIVITTSNKKLASFKQNDGLININGSNIDEENILINKNEKDYIAISKLENVYDYEFNYNENTNVISLDSLNKKQVKAYAKKNIKIKEQPKMFSAKIAKVEKENWIYFISEENGYAKIRTQDGIIGFIKKAKISNFETIRDDFQEKIKQFNDENAIVYDITNKDISTFEKRLNIINLVLQEAIKNDKMYVKFLYNKDKDDFFERFEIEARPMLLECGIETSF